MERHDIKGISTPQGDQAADRQNPFQKRSQIHAAVDPQEGKEKILPAIADPAKGDINIKLLPPYDPYQQRSAGKSKIPGQKLLVIRKPASHQPAAGQKGLNQKGQVELIRYGQAADDYLF